MTEVQELRALLDEHHKQSANLALGPDADPIKSQAAWDALAQWAVRQGMQFAEAAARPSPDEPKGDVRKALVKLEQVAINAVAHLAYYAPTTLNNRWREANKMIEEAFGKKMEALSTPSQDEGELRRALDLTAFVLEDAATVVETIDPQYKEVAAVWMKQVRRAREALSRSPEEPCP